MEIQITGKCDCHCMHCYEDSPKTGELPTQKVKKIIDQVPPDYGIIFAGGEPFLHKGLEELVTYAKDFVVWITTNGHFVTKEKLDGFTEYTILVFGLEGIGSIHDKYRGYKNSYKKVIQALKLTKDRPKEIIATLWKGVLGEIDEIVEIGRKYNSIVHFNALIPVGRAKTNPAILLTQKEKIYAYTKLKNLQKKNSNLLTDLYKLTEKDLKNGIDLFCKSRFCIGVNGDVRPCEFHQAKFGNVFEEDFKDIIIKARETNFYQERERI